MKWLKYRTNHSYGSSRWEYKPLFVERVSKKLKNEIEGEESGDDAFLQNIADQHNWSEHWRGIDFSYIDTDEVPNNRIDNELDSTERSVGYLEKKIIEKRQQVEILKKLIDKGQRLDPDEEERKRRDKQYQDSLEEMRKKQQAEIDKEIEESEGQGI